MNTTNKEIQEVLTTTGKAFNVLNARERKILLSRHGLIDGVPKTLAGLARIEKVTRERIRQIESRAWEKIDLVLKYEE